MVSNIAQFLGERDRAKGKTFTSTLAIDVETPLGFSEDVESVVRDNAAALKIHEFGFAKE